MHYGLTLPVMDGRTFAELAHEAEVAGWDGVFVWDITYGYDPWVLLTAAAMRTERVRLGTLVTPPSRRRPWKLASEAATLDRLSNGRLILPVGLGATGPEHGENDQFKKVGEVTDRKTRARMLDESLDILAGMWSGQPFSYNGEHYHLQDITFSPTPIQVPRVPIWVIGAWPRMKSMQRVLRWDGVLAVKMNADRSFADMTPADIREMKAYIDGQRSEQTPFDFVIEGETPGDDHEKAAAIILPYVQAGLTWWLETVWATPETQGGLEGMRTRIKQGPPRIE
jgi:hypothetical protein